MSGDTPAKILLIAKDRRLWGLLERLLVAAGYVVVDGGSGRETMALLEREGPVGLVLCERTGPGLDEVALFEEIRRDPGHGRVPILALPPADPECTVQALKAGWTRCSRSPSIRTTSSTACTASPGAGAPDPVPGSDDPPALERRPGGGLLGDGGSVRGGGRGEQEPALRVRHRGAAVRQSRDPPALAVGTGAGRLDDGRAGRGRAALGVRAQP